MRLCVPGCKFTGTQTCVQAGVCVGLSLGAQGCVCKGYVNQLSLPGNVLGLCKWYSGVVSMWDAGWVLGGHGHTGMLRVPH